MINVTTVKLPTHFEKSSGLEEDSRFQKVKIYIAHTGENLNHSIFSYDVLENMIPSLANIPILGYVGINGEDEEDFRGHEKRLSINDDGFRVSFETHAYGFIPEDNEAHFETTGGKQWLVANGYLWTRFVDAIELFEGSNGSKGQSMEVGDAEGYTDDRGRMVFTSARFTGLCILGDDVPPAMTGSTISTIFSKEDFKSTFEEMLAEFSAEKGENALATKKKQNEETSEVKNEATGSSNAEKESKATAEAAPNESTAKDASKANDKADEKNAAEDKGVEANTSGNGSEEHGDNEEMSANEDEKDTISLTENESAFKCEKPSENGEDDKKKEMSKKDDGTDTDLANDEEDADDEKEKKAQFELSLSARESAFLQEVRSKFANGSNYTALDAVYEDHGIVRVIGYELSNTHYFNIPYSVNADDSIKLGEKTEVFPTYLTASEKNELETNRAKVKELQTQLEELHAFKSGIEMQAKEASLKSAEGALTADQIKEIKAQFNAKTPEEIEKEIAFAIYTTHKTHISVPASRGGVKAMNFNAKNDYGYGSANELFHK